MLVTTRQRVAATAMVVGLLCQGLLLDIAQAQEESALLTPEQQVEILESFSTALLEHYVLPEKAAQVIDALRQAQARNDFSSSKPIDAFLEQTNSILQTAANDKHLRLLGPQKFSQMMAMFYGDDTDHDQPQPDAHSPSDNPLSVVGVSNVAEISRDGLNQTGYLALERFDGSDRAVAFIERIFSSFTESDNIIIDLRDSGGGDAEMVKALSGYFFDEPTHLLSTTMPGEVAGSRKVVERWTEPNNLSPYFAGKPLKILIAPRTFSAAESFSFGMQAAGRAELVGETTGGGGYINDFFPLPYELGASISVGRTYDPRTGRDWQAIGVIPEVQVELEHALDVALASFTKQSGKLDELGGEELLIYEQMQKYANAWYGADHETMSNLLTEDFVGIREDHDGAEVGQISRTRLIGDTKAGNGQRDNEIYYNRIIRDIEVTGEQATVTLILRETIHRMALAKTGNRWLITRDESADKSRDRA